MNKNNRILMFSLEEGALGVDIKEEQSFSFVRPIGYTDIATWIENRNHARHKEHMKRWLKEWGINTTKGFLDVTHALGINDCLWIKPVDSELDWEQVNLYYNEFYDVAQRTAFESGLYGLELSQTNINDIKSPEFTSEGTCPKCWKVEDDSIYLYKAGFYGACNVGREPYSEYISSKIVKQILPEKTISYDLVMFQKKLCSKCGLFTNEKYGFVPFSKFVDANRVHTINSVLKTCSDIGFERECREMFLTDSIIFNQDRHMGNFGFLVDNDNFEVISFAPLFDYNISMLCNALDEDLMDFATYENEFQLGHKLGGTFSEVGAAILTSDMKDLVPKNITFPVHSSYNMDKVRSEKLADITEQNIKKIMGRKDFFFQCGLK